MQTSTAGLMALISHEGIVLSRYKDSVGVWTIGVGHTKAAGNPDPATFTGSMTIPEVLGLLRHDITKYEAGVNRAIKVPLKQHEFDALVSFHYNTGAIARASLTRSIKAGNKALAAKQFMNWTKPKEITKRRAAERDLFAKGTYPEPYGTIYPATAAGTVQWKKGKRVDLRAALAVSAAPPASATPVPNAVPMEETRPEPAVAGKSIVAGIAAIVVLALGWVGDAPCNLFGVFCQ